MLQLQQALLQSSRRMLLRFLRDVWDWNPAS
jgi:hypothetical protein